MKIKIAHLTSVHKRYDTRIFFKECTSLAKNNNYLVNLIVADGEGDETRNNVNIYDVGLREKDRIKRILKTTQKVYEKAKKLNCDIYHLHDPELIPVGLKLKKLGKKVIYDSHEDFPKQILSKPYLNNYTKKALSKFFNIYEKLFLKKFDYIIAATPFIRNKFLGINKNCIDINNYPLLDEYKDFEIDWNNKKNEICYVGSISKVRGIKEIVEALKFLPDNIKLNLGGEFTEKIFENEVKSIDSWNKVNELGYLHRKEVIYIYKRSKIGLVTLYPMSNYLDSLPVKMFEYMAAGLPVVASNIPFWKKIIEQNKCGICVDPYSPKEIAKAIMYIIENPTEAIKMGINGRKAVFEKFNWSNEEFKLFKIYNYLEKGY